MSLIDKLTVAHWGHDDDDHRIEELAVTDAAASEALPNFVKRFLSERGLSDEFEGALAEISSTRPGVEGEKNTTMYALRFISLKGLSGELADALEEVTEAPAP
ncbi:hypothetical protein GE300_20200 [Rhodobacteraceae bacterium 2CG4]|uniref:Uncharacterized protein n=1 Tax=Halovulum marinum TaxID=2662447 RepID=A0A6L5Z5N8_9RHOB|nr:hypothetical protein [Halovulum marinum]MSU91891.1 hypothetical protein [Halovulum marinum]